MTTDGHLGALKGSHSLVINCRVDSKYRPFCKYFVYIHPQEIWFAFISKIYCMHSQEMWSFQ